MKQYFIVVIGGDDSAYIGTIKDILKKYNANHKNWKMIPVKNKEVFILEISLLNEDEKVTEHQISNYYLREIINEQALHMVNIITEIEVFVKEISNQEPLF